MILLMLAASLFVTLAFGLGPPTQTQHPAEERITAPPPGGGAPSGGAPPSPRRLQEAPPATSRSRPADLGLEPLPDGTFRYVDPDRRFTMTVAPDGRAYFADRWRRPSSSDSQNGKLGRRPGAHSFVTKPMGMAMQGPLEWLVRASGHDLATAAKMGALRDTEAFRTDLAVAWNRNQIEKRLAELPADLLSVWGDESLPLDRRREILFEHWDACEDRLLTDTTGVPAAAVLSVDRLRRRAGEQARTMIESFIRRQTTGQGRAFTSEELARFNARRVSVRRFDPYAETASNSPNTNTPETTPPSADAGEPHDPHAPEASAD